MVQEKETPKITEPTHYRLSVDIFQRMGQAGMFPPDIRLELIRGEIIQMTPMGPRHAFAVSILNRRLAEFAQEVYVWNQCPLVLGDDSIPMPDICLLKLPPEQYAQSLPLPESVLLVIEVADSSLKYDQRTKLPLYAEAGIQEYWIVNLDDNQLEVYRDPKGSDYLTRTTLQPGTPAKALCLSEAIQWD